MPEPEGPEESDNPLTVSRVVHPVTRIATFTIAFPPEQPPDVFFDTNVWVSMNRQNVESLEALKRERGFRYQYSVTNYVELLSRLGRGPASGWENPFAIVRATFRRIRHLCEQEILPSPEMEYLEEVGLSHLIDLAWIPNPGQTGLAVNLISNAETLGDITGEGVQTVRSVQFPRWVIDPRHYFRLTETDENSMRELIEDLSQRTHGRVQRDNLNPLVQWFLKLSTFFLLLRPSQRRATLNSLSPEERNRFCGGFTYGAGRMFKAHVTLIAVKTLNLGERVDPNDLYDALQLLMLRERSRLFVTNDDSFFRYREDETIHRVVEWDGFRSSSSGQT